MRKLAKTSAAALMLSCMAGNVMAAAQASCAHPNEMAAVKTAAIQQRLMVAALTCNSTKLYNSFVLSYQKDLQASDRELQNFFIRMHGKSGTEEYHAFKTRLANESSMASIRDFTGYCASAAQLFDNALTARPTLTAFVSNQETAADTAFALCPVLTAGNTPAVHKAAPVRHKKPIETVVPAQGSGVVAPR